MQLFLVILLLFCSSVVWAVKMVGKASPPQSHVDVVALLIVLRTVDAASVFCEGKNSRVQK